MDHPIPARMPDLGLKKKELGFCCFSRPQIEKERIQKDRQIPGYCQETEKAAEPEGDTTCCWHTWNIKKKKL